MSEQQRTTGRVAVLVDCDNTSPDILDYALRMCAQFGHIVVRQGYGNHTTLANKWQDALVRLAFTPCLQYQYAAGKNTADIALALDALELMFDGRVETFCIVTSDSDFAYLCRKLRGRGATVCIVGEGKTPDALRNASDQFFEYVPVRAEQGEKRAAQTRQAQATRTAGRGLPAGRRDGGRLGRAWRPGAVHAAHRSRLLAAATWPYPAAGHGQDLSGPGGSPGKRQPLGAAEAESRGEQGSARSLGVGLSTDMLTACRHTALRLPKAGLRRNGYAARREDSMAGSGIENHPAE